MSPKKKKIILLMIAVLVIIIIAVLIFKAYSKQYAQKGVGTFLQKEVGVEYAQNFHLISTYIGTNQFPYADGDTRYFTYTFLPFSERYTYTITIAFDTKEKYVLETELPPCVYGKGEKRCDFPVSYSDAYNRAITKFKNGDGDGTIEVTLIENETGFHWKAQKTIGDPLCAPLYQIFFINAINGTETNIKDDQQGWCV